VVGAFRADAARAGAGQSVEALLEELSRQSPEFEAMWRGHDVRDSYGAAPKQLRHPRVGLIALHHSMFAVDGRPISACWSTRRPPLRMPPGSAH
jgi:hypothetical protein